MARKIFSDYQQAWLRAFYPRYTIDQTTPHLQRSLRDLSRPRTDPPRRSPLQMWPWQGPAAFPSGKHPTQQRAQGLLTARLREGLVPHRPEPRQHAPALRRTLGQRQRRQQENPHPDDQGAGRRPLRFPEAHRRAPENAVGEKSRLDLGARQRTGPRRPRRHTTRRPPFQLRSLKPRLHPPGGARNAQLPLERAPFRTGAEPDTRPDRPGQSRNFTRSQNFQHAALTTPERPRSFLPPQDPARHA